MRLFRAIQAFLLTFAFIVSSALSHAHQMPMGSAQAAPHLQMMQHGADADHSHHHQSTVPEGQHASHDADLPHCCSMGACGFLVLTAPDLLLDTVDVSIVALPAPKTRSVSIVPEAPPPRRKG